MGTPGQDVTLASGTSCPAQHKQLGPRVHPAPCAPSTCSCIQQGPAQHGTDHSDIGCGGSRERVRGTAGTGRMWPVPHSHQTAPATQSPQSQGGSQPLGTPGSPPGGRPGLPLPAPCPHHGWGHGAIPWGLRAQQPPGWADPAHCPGLAPLTGLSTSSSSVPRALRHLPSPSTSSSSPSQHRNLSISPINHHLLQGSAPSMPSFCIPPLTLCAHPSAHPVLSH